MKHYFSCSLFILRTFQIIRFTYDYKAGKQQATDVVGEVFIPPTMEAETCYCPLPNAFIPGSWEIDVDKRKIILKVIIAVVKDRLKE